MTQEASQPTSQRATERTREDEQPRNAEEGRARAEQEDLAIPSMRTGDVHADAEDPSEAEASTTRWTGEERADERGTRLAGASVNEDQVSDFERVEG